MEGVAATCNDDESEAVAEADTDGELLADVEALFARDCDGDGVIVTDAEALDEPVDDCDEMRGRHASERSRTSGAARADMVPLARGGRGLRTPAMGAKDAETLHRSLQLVTPVVAPANTSSPGRPSSPPLAQRQRLHGVGHVQRR